MQHPRIQRNREQRLILTQLLLPHKYSHVIYTPCVPPVQTETKSKQSSQMKDRQKGVPFLPPGYLHYPTDLLRSRFSRAECLAELEQELAAAWPQTFLQVDCSTLLYCM